MHRGWMPVALAVVVAACAPIPPPRAVQVPVRQFSVGDARLPSGLHIIVEDDASARVVATALVIGAGAADDPPGQEGLAHLVEHLSFRSHPEGQPALSSRLALQGIGAWNAVTSMDTTTYFQVGPPDTLASMLDADISRMLHPLQGVDADHFLGERGVVLSELQWRDESGQFHAVRRSILEQLFPPNHPYARGVGGTPETVSHLTLEQATTWSAAHYRPTRMTWVIAGALQREPTARMLAAKVPPELSDASALETPRVRPRTAVASPPPAPPTLPRVPAPVDRPTLRVAWTLPPARGTQETVIASLPALVESRWAEGIESTDAALDSFEDASVLTLDLEIKDGADPEKVLAELRKDWSAFWREGTLTSTNWIEKRFADVRAATIVALARHNDSLLVRTVNRALRARSSLDAATLKQQNAAIGQLTYRELLVTGARYVTGENLRAVLLTPAAAGTQERESRSPAAPVFAPELVRAEYPADNVGRFVRGPGLGRVSTFRARNGLEVVVVPEEKSGLVTLTLGLPGGRRTSSPPGLSDRLMWSVQSFDYAVPSSVGASVESWWTDDTGFLQYRGSAGNLPNLLAMMAERILTRRVVDPPKASFARASTHPQLETFDRFFWRAVHGDAAVARRRPLAELAKLSGSDAQRWLEQVLDPKRAVLVVSGDVRGSVQDEVEHWLERWSGSGGTAGSSLPPLPAAPGTLRVVKTALPHAKQVRVRLACATTGSTLEEEIALQLLATEVERQWNVLERETLGSSYGFSATTSAHRDGTHELLIAGRVNNEGMRRMAVAAAQAWKSFPELASTDTKLNRLKWEFGRAYNVSFLGSEMVGTAVAQQRLQGRPPSVLDEVPKALMRVNAEQMGRVGRQCKESAVLGLLGDPSALDVDALLPGAKTVAAR
jgi:zinc protease